MADVISMNETTQRIEKFVDYAKKLKGDEKSEAQVFCERLFQAFGHEGYKEAGAVLAHNISLDDVSEFLKYSPLIPPGRVTFFTIGILAGLQGRFIEALHVLVPQLGTLVWQLAFLA